MCDVTLVFLSINFYCVATRTITFGVGFSFVSLQEVVAPREKKIIPHLTPDKSTLCRRKPRPLQYVALYLVTPGRLGVNKTRLIVFEAEVLHHRHLQVAMM